MCNEKVRPPFLFQMMRFKLIDIVSKDLFYQVAFFLCRCSFDDVIINDCYSASEKYVLPLCFVEKSRSDYPSNDTCNYGFLNSTQRLELIRVEQKMNKGTIQNAGNSAYGLSVIVVRGPTALNVVVGMSWGLLDRPRPKEHQTMNIFDFCVRWRKGRTG